MSYVFQEPTLALNPVRRVGEQSAETLIYRHGTSAAAAQQAMLELFGEVALSDPERIWSAYPHELSGGERQRVLIAAALSVNPKVLIADEPTAALDTATQQDLLHLLQALRARRGLSILFITHHLGLLPGFADRVLVMDQGCIVETGTPEQLLQHAEHEATQRLVRSLWVSPLAGAPRC
jgi:peptide/nickel transport system ATP-binding protein